MCVTTFPRCICAFLPLIFPASLEMEVKVWLPLLLSCGIWYFWSLLVFWASGLLLVSGYAYLLQYGVWGCGVGVQRTFLVRCLLYAPPWLQQKLLLVAVKFFPPAAIENKGKGQAEHNRCSCCFCWHSKSAFFDVTDNFCVSWRDEILISLNISNGYESNILLCLIYGYVLPLPVDYLDW